MRIYLYKDYNESNLNIEELKRFIKETFGNPKIIIRGKFIESHIKNQKLDEVAKELASIRVKNVLKPHLEYTPFYGEIKFEKRYLTGKIKQIKGILYDGVKLMLIYSNLIPNNENLPDLLHIVITDRLIGTYSKGDGRYHIRSIICSGLSLISTAGIVEGPVKPKIFYKLKHQCSAEGLNIPIEILKEQFKGQFIDYNDPNLTEVVKGYISQALFFNLTGMPFCSDKTCRLFNAHWQSELIYAQLVSRKFCVIHNEYLEKFKIQNSKFN
ncbi:MAG: DUF6775 family putative metallopeptidase [Promethearchaeota archaeon]